MRSAISPGRIISPAALRTPPPARPARQGRCAAALEVAIDVLIDGRSLGDCDRQRRWRNGTAAKFLVYALGVYADMAGWEQNRETIGVSRPGGRGGGRRERGVLGSPDVPASAGQACLSPPP